MRRAIARAAAYRPPQIQKSPWFLHSLGRYMSWILYHQVL